MSSLLYEIIFIVSLSYCLTGPILPSYERDEGDWPVGTSANMDNVIDRWFIDIKDAKCKPLEYRGIKGNYNNFASKGLCEMHTTLTVREKLQGCKQPMHPGHCVKNPTTTSDQYYFDPTSATCKSLTYNGCGGSFNRYANEEECLLYCFNKRNGGLTNADDSTITAINHHENYAVPNSLDCTLRPDVKDKDPSTAIIADTANRKCAYAAVSIDSNTRGIFSSFGECVKKCFPNQYNIPNVPVTTKKVQACHGNLPVQYGVRRGQSMEYKYYYSSTTKTCLRMETGPNPDSSIVFDPTKNNFPTMEMCHSYCGAENYVKKIHVEETCTQPKKGAVSTGTYTIKRFYYDHTNKVCQAFRYKGYDGNSNNFTSGEQCRKICGDVYRQREREVPISDREETA